MQLQESVDNGKGPNYNLFTNNCVQQTMDAVLHGNIAKEEREELEKIKDDIIPNWTYDKLREDIYKSDVLEEFDMTHHTIMQLEAKGKSRTQMAYELSRGF